MLDEIHSDFECFRRMLSYQSLNDVYMKRPAHVLRGIIVIRHQGLVVDADDKVAATSIAQSKNRFDDLCLARRLSRRNPSLYLYGQAFDRSLDQLLNQFSIDFSHVL